jgi:hypothetical protein
LAACGGGGGGGGGFIPDDNSEDAYFLTLRLLDPDGNPTNTITVLEPGTLEVRVTREKSSGRPIADEVVNAQVSLGRLFPASGTALTNSDGVATFQIEAEAQKGGGTVTASVDGPTGTVSETLNYQVGVAGLRLGYFDENGLFMENEIGITPSSTLSSQGQAQLTVAIVDEAGKRVETAESVRFSSDCLSTGRAALDPESPINTVTGEVTTSYTAQGCSGDDEVVASLRGGSSQAFGLLSVAPATANRLTFVSAEPELIVLKGTGGGPNRQEFSDVIFRAVDGNNQPLQGIEVQFSLTTFVGGLSVSPLSAFSDADGNVRTSIFSGDVATVVRVIATTAAGDGTGEISTVSDVLSVSTGLPDQNSISLSVAECEGESGFIVENGMTEDGKCRTLSVSMADKFNNPVPDGTAASFITELGIIEPSCTTVNGECSVQWRSGNPRTPTLDAVTDSIKTINSPGYSCPSHNGSSGPCPDDLGFTRGGRSTILVTAIGEESFIDRNGNGIMDEDERDLFDNVAEAHWDYNEDDVYNPADPSCEGVPIDEASDACVSGFEEQFVDYNSNGVYDRNNDPALYNGLLCPVEGDGNWCSRELVNVRDDTVLTLSAGETLWDILLTRGRSVTNTLSEGLVYTAYIADLFNSAPPAGSKVSVTATGDCEVVTPSSDIQPVEVPNIFFQGAYALTVEIGSKGGDTEGEGGTVDIELTPPSDENGTPYVETFNCATLPPPPDPNDDGLVVSGGG